MLVVENRKTVDKQRETLSRAPPAWSESLGPGFRVSEG